jgi:hypothetical protein
MALVRRLSLRWKRKRPAVPGVSMEVGRAYWGFACAETAFADAITGSPFNWFIA